MNKTSKTQNKRIYLKTIAAAGLPLALISSCATTTDVVNLHIGIKTPEDITYQEIETITQQNQDINSSNLLIIKKLWKIDSSLDSDIIKGLQVKKLSSDKVGQYQLELMAKEGYVINGDQKALFSSAFQTKPNFLIENNTSADINEMNIADSRLTEIPRGPSPVDITESMFNTISKVFDFKHSDKDDVMRLLQVKRVDIARLIYKLELSPKMPGVDVNGQTKTHVSAEFATHLDSPKDMVISRREDVSLTHEEIAKIPVEPKELEISFQPIVNKIFNLDGVDEAVQLDGSIIVHREGPIEGNKFKVILTPGNRHTINGETIPFVSLEFPVNVMVTLSNKDGKITPTEMGLIPNGIHEMSLVEVEIVKKVVNFGSVMSSNQDIQKIFKLEKELNTVDGTVTFTLTTDNPYILINGTNKSFKTVPFSVNHNFNVTRADLGTSPDNPQAITLDEMYDNFNLNVGKEGQTIEVASQRATIEKFFNFTPALQASDFSNFFVKLTKTDNTKFTLTLIPQEGVMIGNSTDDFVSNTINLREDILVEAKEINLIEGKISSAEMKKIGLISQNITVETLAIVKKAFDITTKIDTPSSLDKKIMASLQVRKIVIDRTAKLILTLKHDRPEFLLNNSNQPVSTEFFAFEIIDIILERKNIIETITENDLKLFSEAQGVITQRMLTVLKKVFNITNDVDVTDGLMVKKSAPASGNVYTFTLEIKPGYTINGKKDAYTSSDFTVIKSVSVGAKPNHFMREITNQEIDSITKDTPTLITLEQVGIIDKVLTITIPSDIADDATSQFEFIQKAFKLHKTGGVETNNVYTLVLTANDGYNIDNWTKVPEISSNTFTVNVDLLIESKIDLPNPVLSVADLTLFSNTSTQVKDNQVEIIKRLFKFDPALSPADIMNSLSVHKEKVSATGHEYKLVIKSNLGYTINGGTSELPSTTFTVPLSFEITLKETSEITLTGTQITLISKEAQAIDENNIQIIKSVFNLPHVTNDEIFKGLKVKRESNPTDATKFKFILIANPNFMINSTLDILESNEFSASKSITVVVKQRANIKITSEELASFGGQTVSEFTEEQLATILKAFEITGLDSVFQANAWFNAVVNVVNKGSKVSLERKITLTVKPDSGLKFLVNGTQQTSVDAYFALSAPMDIVIKSQVNNVQITKEDMANILPIAGSLTEKNYSIIKKLFITNMIYNVANKGLEVHKIAIENKTNVYKLVLTAKEGYVFSDGSTVLMSNEFTVKTKLEVTINADPKLDASELVDFVNGLVTELNLPIINKVFTFNPPLSSFDPNEAFDVTLQTTNGINGYVLILDAKNGYSFNNSSTFQIEHKFVASQNLLIKPIAGSVTTGHELLHEQVMSFSEEFKAMTTEQLEIIKTLFEIDSAITDSVLMSALQVKRSVQEVGSNKFTIILNSNPGFSINGIDELTSYSITSLLNFEITKNASDIINVTELEINSILNTYSLITKDTLQIVLKVFNVNDYANNYSNNMIGNVTVKKTMLAGNKYTLELEGKQGVVFNSGEWNYVSNQFSVPVKLELAPISGVVISQTELDHLIGPDYQAITDDSVTLINKLFTNKISPEILKTGLMIKVTTVNGVNTISLQTNEGFYINVDGVTETSTTFTIATDLTVETIAVTEVTELDVEGLTDGFLDVTNITLELLKKFFVFKALDPAILIQGLQVKLTTNSVNDISTITLKAKPGYSINTIVNGEFTSIDFTITPTIINFDLEAITIIGPINKADVEGLTDGFLDVTNITLPLLAKFFDFKALDPAILIQGLQVKLTTNSVDGLSTITLKAKTDYTINGLTNELPSNTFTITAEIIDLTLSKIDVTTATEAEVKGLLADFENVNENTLILLAKFFNIDLNADNANILKGLQVKLTTNSVDGLSTITLKAKLGYSINTIAEGELLSTNFMIAKNAVNITLESKNVVADVTEAYVEGLGEKFVPVSPGPAMTFLNQFFNFNELEHENMIAGLEFNLKRTIGTNGVVTGVINLKVKDGANFTINNGSTSLPSISFTITPEIIDISVTQISPLGTIDASEFSHLDATDKEIDQPSFDLIQKLFTIEPSMDLLALKAAFTIKMLPDTNVITLNVITGHTINGSLTTINSLEFTVTPSVTKELPSKTFTVRPAIVNFQLFTRSSSEVDITSYEIDSIGFKAEDIDRTKLEIVKKSFNLGNVTDEDIMKGLQVRKETTKEQDAYTLVLVAKLGYTINR